MPARVHAVIVVRPDGRSPAAMHLRRTLAALDAQRRPADDLTIVLCGQDAAVREIAATSGAEAVISAPASTRFAAATALATPRVHADALWLLAQDTAPEPDALVRLAGSLELAPSVAFVGPKLVRGDDRTEIVSLGVSMSTLGRTVGLSDGQLDQGQLDAREDVLGSDVRGILIRTDAWRELGGLDQALAGADEGLDLGVRARLAGARVSLVPSALVAVEGDGVAGLPAPRDGRRERRRAYAERTAQLHRRLVYAAPPFVPLLWLAMLPVALWRTVVHLVAKRPGLVWPEWRAGVTAMVRWGAVARSRRRLRAARRGSHRAGWTRIAPLRLTASQLRHRFDVDVDPLAGPDALAGRRALPRSDLRFFSGGGAWLVLAGVLLSIAVFPALLAWPSLGGGALEPLRATVSQLWTDAAYGLRATGVGTVGPADPFAVVIAILGSLWPGEPSRAVVLLWLAALPIAALGGWFAATRVTERSPLRFLGGAVWMLAPTFLTALVQGRPTAVIAHLLLPWLFYTGSVAARSWAAAAAASLVFVAVVASAPSLAPGLVLLWATAIAVTLATRARRGVARVIWIVIPAAVFAAPLVWRQVVAGDPWALLADPGVPWAGPQVAADGTGRALLAAGFPTSDAAGWSGLLGAETPVWWVPLLAAPLVLLALVAPLTWRWAAGVSLLAIAAVGIATAFAAVGVAVSFSQGQPASLWPGNGVSLAWLGLAGGALVALDARLAPRLRMIRSLAGAVALLGVVVLAAAPLTAVARGTSNLTNGPASSLPAFVAAEGRDNLDVGTLVLTPQNRGGVSSRLVWGASETIGSHATILDTRMSASPADGDIAELTADLVTSSAGDVVARLAATGAGFVLLAPADDPESDAARTLRLGAQTALDQRAGLDAVGDTPAGELWRVTEALAPRPAENATVRDRARWIAIAQAGVVLVALLLAVPTRASRRAARLSPRVVGPYRGEEL